jgi:hypothetical protein
MELLGYRQIISNSNFVVIGTIYFLSILLPVSPAISEVSKI